MSAAEPRKPARTTASQRRKAAREAGYDPLQLMQETLGESRRRRLRKLAQRAAASPRAAIELKCLDCCAWERPEVRRCRIVGCALWPFRGRIFGDA